MVAPNKIELFQSFCRQYVNRQVREFFRDRDEDIPDNFSDIFDRGNPEHIIKALCLHDDRDTIQNTLFAFDFFYQYINPIPINLDDIIYGIPKADYEERVQYKPQLELFFTQNYEERERDKEKGAKSPVRMEISLRVFDTNKYQLTLGPENNPALEELGRDIKRNFQDYQYEKGIYIASYFDPKKGVRLIIPYQRELECRELIRRVLDSVDITPDYERFFKPDGREDKNLGQFEETTGKVKPEYIDKELMLGERKNRTKDRAIGTVFLYRATLKVHQRDPVILCHYKKGKGLIDL